MNPLNSVLIEGTLTKDPELSQTPKGISICEFTIASTRFYKIDGEYQKEVSFFDVTTFARLAILCGESLKKGRGVRIIGRLKQERLTFTPLPWEEVDGEEKSRIYIIADHVEFKPDLRKGVTQ